MLLLMLIASSDTDAHQQFVHDFMYIIPLQVLTMVLNYPFLDSPDVTLTYGSGKVTCYADANPPVPEPIGYKIIINDTDEYEPVCANGACTHELKVGFDTDVRCNATNTVGTGTTTVVAVPGNCFVLVFQLQRK